MIRPERLRRGDRIAVVSLSSGLLGDPGLIHRYHTAKKRLEENYGLIVEPTPHALKGTPKNQQFPLPTARNYGYKRNHPHITNGLPKCYKIKLIILRKRTIIALY